MRIAGKKVPDSQIPRALLPEPRPTRKHLSHTHTLMLLRPRLHFPGSHSFPSSNCLMVIWGFRKTLGSDP